MGDGLVEAESFEVGGREAREKAPLGRKRVRGERDEELPREPKAFKWGKRLEVYAQETCRDIAETCRHPFAVIRLS